MAKKQNLEKLKAMFEKNGGSGGDMKWWKPKDNGEYQIRLLPPVEDDGLFYKATAQYNLGGKYLFAPYVEGKPDPIYDYYRALWKEGTPKAIETAKEIKPRKQYLFNIVVREEKGKKTENPTKVYIYTVGQKLYEKIMHYFWDEDYGDLTDVEEGFDFKVRKEEGDLGFPNYDNSAPRNKSTPLFEEQDMIDEVLAHLYNLEEEVVYPTAEELRAELENYLQSKKETKKLLQDVENSEKSSVTTASRPSAPAVDDDESLNDFEAELLKQISN
jgi:hypothetical protein